MERGQKAMGGVHQWLFAAFSKGEREEVGAHACARGWGAANSGKNWLIEEQKGEVRVGKFGNWV